MTRLFLNNLPSQIIPISSICLSLALTTACSLIISYIGYSTISSTFIIILPILLFGMLFHQFRRHEHSLFSVKEIFASIKDILISISLGSFAFLLPLDNILKTSHFLLYDPFIIKPLVLQIIAENLTPTNFPINKLSNNGFYFFMTLLTNNTGIEIDLLTRFGGPILLFFTAINIFFILNKLTKNNFASIVGTLLFSLNTTIIGNFMMTIRENFTFLLGIHFLLLLLYIDPKKKEYFKVIPMSILLSLILASHILVYLVVILVFVFYCAIKFIYVRNKRILIFCILVLLIGHLLASPYIRIVKNNVKYEVSNINENKDEFIEEKEIINKSRFKFISLDSFYLSTYILAILGLIYSGINLRKRDYSFILAFVFTSVLLLISTIFIRLPAFRLKIYLIIPLVILASYSFLFLNPIMHKKNIYKITIMMGLFTTLFFLLISGINVNKWAAWDNKEIDATIWLKNNYSENIELYSINDNTLLNYAGFTNINRLDRNINKNDFFILLNSINKTKFVYFSRWSHKLQQNQNVINYIQSNNRTTKIYDKEKVYIYKLD